MSPVATTNTGGNPFLNRAYNTSNLEDLASVYDDWSATFDADMADQSQDYVAPMLIANAIARNLNVTDDVQVLDAGCGTGLSGLALLSRLSTDSASATPANSINIEGVDLSEGMLKVAARTQAYRTLRRANLNLPLTSLGITDGTYDAIICVGTLTHGHVGPNVLSEFARVTKHNGVIAATVLDDLWESGGYRAEVDKLVHSGDVVVIENEVGDYRRGAGVMARVLVLRKVIPVTESANTNP